MKNKKGFTMIELLASLAILGILMLIAVPALSRLVSSNDDNYYSSLEGMVQSYGQSYFQDRRTLLPRENGNIKTISIEDLVRQKYGDQPFDVKENKCVGKVIVQKLASGKYQYTTCLDCPQYQSTGKVCSYTEESNDKVVITGVKNTNVKHGINYKVPLASAMINGEKIADVFPSPSLIDTNFLTTYDVYYTYRNTSLSVKYQVTDQTPPTKPTISLTLQDGRAYKSDSWTNQTVVQKIVSADISPSGANGSGIKEFQISYDNQKNWSSIKSSGEIVLTQTNNINQIIYVKAVDYSGQFSEVASYSIKIDRVSPTCVSSGGSTLWSANRTIYGTCSDQGGSGCKISRISKVYAVSTNTASPGSVCDNAGNCSACPSNQMVRVDNKPPTFQLTGLNSGWVNSSNRITIVAQDNESGLASYPYSFNGGTTWTSSNWTTFSTSTNFTVAVRDKAGHITTANYSVQIDKVKPTYTYSVLGDWNQTGSTIEFNASDTQSGIDKMLWFAGNYDSTSLSKAKRFEKSFYTTSYRNVAWAFDRAGNSVSVYLYSKVDRTAPGAPTLDEEKTRANGITVNCLKNEFDSLTDNYCILTKRGSTMSWSFYADDNYNTLDSGISGAVQFAEKIEVNDSLYRDWKYANIGTVIPRVTISNASRKKIIYRYKTRDAVGLESSAHLILELKYL